MIRRNKPVPRPTKPIKRSRIRYKKRVRKVSWRNPARVREDAQGIELLRWECFNRSYFDAHRGRPHNRCENKMEDGSRCRSEITWESFEMHHLGPARDRSDTLDKVMACCHGCHADNHRGTWKASRWNQNQEETH